MRALAWAAVVAGASACATTEPAAAPMIIVTERGVVGARGAACGVKPALARGAVPAQARVIAHIELRSDAPRSMRAFEDLARLKAMQMCASNVSLLSAVDDDGRGILSVTAALWESAP